MPDRRTGRRGSTAETRTCDACGRVITWRASLARSWEQVRWCSDACRRRGRTPADAALEAELLAAVTAHPRGTRVDLDTVAASWGRPVEREDLRSAARRLAGAGRVEFVQGGRVVDPSTARGPVALRARG